MTRLTTAALAIAVLLLVPASSHAGGWASVGLSSLPGDDSRPGGTWVVDLTVLQHGMTPLEGLTPMVRLAPEEGADPKALAFEAAPAKGPGVYRARVELPSEGVWAISVHDGFSGVHEFGSVRMGDDGATMVGGAKFNPVDRASAGPASPPIEPAPSESGSGIALGTALLLAGLAGLLAAGLVAAVAQARGRREGPSPASG